MIKDVQYADFTSQNVLVLNMQTKNMESRKQTSLVAAETFFIILNVNFVSIKPILKKLLGITFMVLKQEWITCLESLETLFHKWDYDILNNPCKNMINQTFPVENFVMWQTMKFDELCKWNCFSYFARKALVK